MYTCIYIPHRWSSALHLAIHACAKPGDVGQKSVEIVRMFIELRYVLGLDANAQDIDGRTPLHEAVGVGDRCWELMDVLVEVRQIERDDLVYYT